MLLDAQEQSFALEYHNTREDVRICPGSGSCSFILWAVGLQVHIVCDVHFLLGIKVCVLGSHQLLGSMGTCEHQRHPEKS